MVSLASIAPPCPFVVGKVVRLDDARSSIGFLRSSSNPAPPTSTRRRPSRQQKWADTSEVELTPIGPHGSRCGLHQSCHGQSHQRESQSPSSQVHRHPRSAMMLAIEEHAVHSSRWGSQEDAMGLGVGGSVRSRSVAPSRGI